MRPTKEALIRRACPDMALSDYHIDSLLTDDFFKEHLAQNHDKVIYAIAAENNVGEKLFLTSHQFTNAVGTDIYIYIGNSQGQEAYQKILAELSKVRRLDERLTAYLRDECLDCMIELASTGLTKEVILQATQDHPEKIIYAMPSESHINRGIGLTLADCGFTSIGESHLFIYSGNIPGEKIITRLEQDSFVKAE